MLLALLLGGCAPAQAEVPAIPTPTATPQPSRTPIPTVTPTATPVSACPPGAKLWGPLPDLLLGQHISASGSYTQTETEAAGRMACRIQRDGCAYIFLVGNLDPSIVFKQEEEPPYDEEDILMHPDMLLPLYRLNQLVQAEWEGAYRLRITDAYDSLLEHDLWQLDESRKYSLHFEGRSLDLTTWPVEPTRYGRLCALAHCAGFDWVQHEGDHCHVSISAPSLCIRCRD